MERIPMTATGHRILEEEVQHLKTVERHSIIRMIAEARAHGDLSENAEYHAAKERQSFIEGRVMDLEYKLSCAEVIDISKLSGKTVTFGATVTLSDEESGAKVKYQIVGDLEADLKKGKLSISSPVARALIGKVVGDTVEVIVTAAVGRSLPPDMGVTRLVTGLPMVWAEQHERLGLVRDVSLAG